MYVYTYKQLAYIAVYRLKGTALGKKDPGEAKEVITTTTEVPLDNQDQPV